MNLFGIAFEGPKNVFNTQKALFKSPKSLKMTKTQFWKKLKNEVFVQKHFFT
jgi:hypothetical protein